MKKAYFYCGSNNETHELEVEKIEETVSNYFEGFTTSEVVGYWKRTKEKTLKVEVITDEPDAKLVRLGKELKRVLNQEAVLLEVVESNASLL